LETVVVIHHQLKNFNELLGFTNIKNLFLTDNQIDSLEGIETLTGLEQLYCNSNFITSIKPIQGLKTLKTFYINNNQLTSLEGLTKHHAHTLKTFFCLPNDNLPYKEIIRVEHKLGIKCSKG
jgi:Leucine-rich repeat (LRR) protein